MFETQVFGWARKFKNERETIANVIHNRRPRSSVTASNIGAVRDLTEGDWQLVIHEVALKVSISFGRIQTMFRNVIFSMTKAGPTQRL